MEHNARSFKFLFKSLANNSKICGEIINSAHKTTTVKVSTFIGVPDRGQGGQLPPLDLGN